MRVRRGLVIERMKVRYVSCGAIAASLPQTGLHTGLPVNIVARLRKIVDKAVLRLTLVQVVHELVSL